jgi:hypothetical protein
MEKTGLRINTSLQYHPLHVEINTFRIVGMLCYVHVALDSNLMRFTVT